MSKKSANTKSGTTSSPMKDASKRAFKQGLDELTGYVAHGASEVVNIGLQGAIPPVYAGSMSPKDVSQTPHVSPPDSAPSQGVVDKHLPDSGPAEVTSDPTPGKETSPGPVMTNDRGVVDKHLADLEALSASLQPELDMDIEQ